MYDPPMESAYLKQFKVDNEMCLIEVIDTSGQGMLTALDFDHSVLMCEL